ncbi:hypothetical protein [Halorubrum distributum]|uniref:hypothetical protein n=1 Tax=Halorubrum distributum TaxID=29283 RepID=UPI0012681DD1|nr:hypothetical protein [Halorubrum arcis]
MVRKGQTREVTKTLPLSGEEIDIEINVTGSEGEDVEIKVAKPRVDFSEETRDQYKDERLGPNLLWHETMEAALNDTEYDVQRSTHKSRSGNVYFKGGKVSFNYFEEARIHEVIEKILHQLDSEIVLENRRRETEKVETEAAQSQVSDGVLDQLNGIELSE